MSIFFVSLFAWSAIHPNKHSNLILDSLTENNSINATEKNYYFMDSVGIEWSVEELKILRQMSSYLKSLSDETFMQNVLYSADL